MSDFNKKLSELRVWIEQTKVTLDLFPQISRTYQEMENYKLYLDKAPPSANELAEKIANEYEPGLTYLLDTLGEPMTIDPANFGASIGYIATGATGSILVLNEEKPADAQANTWKYGFIDVIRSSQEERRVNDDIAKILTSLFPKLGVEFAEMVDEHDLFMIDVTDSSSFGIKMRNVIEHFKGLLKLPYDIAIHGKPKKGSDPTWNKIAEHVVIGGKDSRNVTNFIKLNQTYLHLHGNLSGDAKDYTVEDKAKLSGYFVEIVQLFDALLKLVDVAKIEAALKIAKRE